MKKNISSLELKKMCEITPEKVDIITQRLAHAYDPLFIYAFGSYARGTYDEESDLDLMVVVQEYDDKPWKMISRGYASFRDVMMPVDLLVYNNQKFNECKNDSMSFCYKIINSGKILYEKKES
ncbi:MAG: nucleotidyltransferase domain-containing protein [Candidatus Babeliales bacterium]